MRRSTSVIKKVYFLYILYIAVFFFLSIGKVNKAKTKYNFIILEHLIQSLTGQDDREYKCPADWYVSLF